MTKKLKTVYCFMTKMDLMAKYANDEKFVDDIVKDKVRKGLWRPNPENPTSVKFTEYWCLKEESLTIMKAKTHLARGEGGREGGAREREKGQSARRSESGVVCVCACVRVWREKRGARKGGGERAARGRQRGRVSIHPSSPTPLLQWQGRGILSLSCHQPQGDGRGSGWGWMETRKTQIA